MQKEPKRCARCILSENFPKISYDENGFCNFCNDKMIFTTEQERINEAALEINSLIKKLKGKSECDAVLCYSGGKDSTYTLKIAIEKYNLKVLSFTLDNGFISSTAFKNIEKVVNRLGVDHITYKPSYSFMKELFRVSTVESIYNPKSFVRISANCNSCISMVNITALKLALEKDIPFIIAGFTLGQIPSNTIYYQNNYGFFRESRQPVLDKLKEHLGPDVSRYLEIGDELLKKAVLTPYNINLLTLENISEPEIIEQIQTLGWEKPGDVDGCSTNCRINAFNNYVHQMKHGYNPYELELSHLIRKGLLKREKALDAINDQSYDQVLEIFRELDIDPANIRNAANISF